MGAPAIESDLFASTVEELLNGLDVNIGNALPTAVERALDKGEKAWKENAKSVLSVSYSRGGWGKEKGDREYYKSGPRKGQVRAIKWYGKTYKTGRYARSIRHHMLMPGGRTPEGEIGSASMPGLAHLLEKGHASIGGGYVPAYEHISPAADDAFSDFETLVEEAIEEALNDL